jgi:hypothetical protein
MKDIEARFKKTVVEHEMIVVKDDGLFRHLTFKSARTYNNHFHITTWPGYLAITGDIGSYVFARLPDMFRFFRGDDINPSYWAEKLQACDRSGGVTEFSEDFFHAAIKSDFDQWEFEDEEQKAKAWEALQESNLSEDSGPESLNSAIGDAMSYKCPVTGNTFDDFWEHDLEDYTFRFLWCCHAIRWAVAEVDRRALSVVSEVRGGDRG